MDGRQPSEDFVAFHGLVRDDRGQKMSKSTGNVVDPLDWMEAYGADALRFTLARGANPGTDVPVGEEWVEGAATSSTSSGTPPASRCCPARPVAGAARVDELSTADRWILSRLDDTVAEVDALYEDFQFAKARDALYHFAWDEVCDWYVELAKIRWLEGGAAQATRRVLGHVLDVLLRLLHPVIPFVTEKLWTTLTGGESVVIAAWPAAAYAVDRDSEREVGALQEVVTEVRRFRAEQGLRPRQKVPARHSSAADAALAAHTRIGALATLTDLRSMPETQSLTVGRY